MGRVAMATPLGPRIVPVNYGVHDDEIVFRTAPYSELSTYGWDTDLAFEVDDLDYVAHQAGAWWPSVARTSWTTPTRWSSSARSGSRSRGPRVRATST
ncbi:MAG: pyridoxamine 5'-phosphate oxidase family protein [Actinomycetota bacterium]|nr:pyridoxamine 5'-phosphate oxidase family protein [Actinomycetota bacterium]